jgi:putative glutamine amidotransferase
MRIELETDRFYLARHYSEAVEAAGGVPVHISLIPDADYIASVMDGLDGILLPGSDSDVDPARYQTDPHPNLGSVHPIKDQTDALVLEQIELRNMPLLAICFGMQILNVSRGGRLVQDIQSQLPNAIKHQQGLPRDHRSHAIRIEQGSALSGLAESETAFVNSHHHQAIDSVGRELIATAWTSDGITEAMEDSRKDRFVFAVQWHPEIGWRDDPLSQRIFTKFVKAAEQFGTANDTGRRLEQAEEQRV